ncbi:MAG: sulfatase-like hydrolase/transferase [Verrucomicrobiota bacterium]
MKSLLASLILAVTSAISATAVDRAPNIVLIFIDDMGYGDIGPFGNTINQTPHLDRMAAEGNVLRQFYVANTACTPSRAALLTGTYAHRIGMDGSVVFPGESRGLNPDEITIAEMLKKIGYATGCFGKWHLGDQKPFLPLAQGFDKYFGIPYSNDMWPGNARGNPVTDRGPYEPLPVILQNEPVAHVADNADQSLLAEVVTDAAVNFIRENQDQPFFCYVPHAYVHHPRFARPHIMERADGNVDRANVEEIDDSVGRILDTLVELEIDERTLVLFTSDNGGAGGMSMGPLRGGKGGAKFEGHMRVPTIAWWPGKIEAGSETNAIAVTTDLLPTFAALSGAEVPADRTIDGMEVVDILLGEPAAKSPHVTLFYEVEGIRRGDWKLVRVPIKKKGIQSQLFNLAADLGERQNLAQDHPDIVGDLETLLREHAEKIASDTRPAAFVEDAKPILTEPGNLPTLRDYAGKPDTTVATDKPQNQGAALPQPPSTPGAGADVQPAALPPPEPARPVKGPFPVVEHLLPPAQPSLLPQYTFSDTLAEQEKELAVNPLLGRYANSRAALADDPFRPYYHFVNPEGRLNDPNGLCYWQGQWHLFYQAYPPEDPRQHWGHAVSDDLIHWRDLPVAIYPVPEEKCFSGSTLVEEDRVIAAYHGIGRGTMIAVSSDPILLNWEKVTGDAVIKLKEEGSPDLPYEVFDPSIWKEGDYYYLLTAGQTKTGPAGKVMRQQFLHRSQDLETWEYLHPFVENDFYGMVGDDGACPYFWPIGTPQQGKHIMLHFSHMSGGKYLLGDYDTERQKFVVTNGGDFNHGPVSPGGTHAPSACPDPRRSGAVVGLFNMNPGIKTPDFNHWNQIMSLPRRWTLSDEGTLEVVPTGGIKSLRRDLERVTSQPLPQNEEIELETIQGNAMELLARIGPKTAQVIELKVLRSPEDEEFTRILIHPRSGYKMKDGVRRDRQQRVFTHGTLTIDTTRSSILPDVLARPPEVAPYLLKEDKTLNLRVFIDKSIVEVFLNGVQCAAVRVYPGREDSTGVSLRAIGGDAQLINLNAWQMDNIYE